MDTKYGKCRKCKTPLEPVWFVEEEYNYTIGRPTKTGRSRIACSHLECPCCLTRACVDDSFDGDWK